MALYLAVFCGGTHALTVAVFIVKLLFNLINGVDALYFFRRRVKILRT